MGCVFMIDNHCRKELPRSLLTLHSAGRAEEGDSSHRLSLALDRQQKTRKLKEFAGSCGDSVGNRYILNIDVVGTRGIERSKNRLSP